jgi:glycine betaine/proline transport system substrate-binding protein
MITALGNAIDSNEEIVVTGWTPHAKFANYELRFLEDPQGVYGQPEQVKTVVHEGLESENGGAYAFFDEFDWTQLDLLQVIAEIADGTDPAQAAEAFVTENQSSIDSLLPDHPAFE